MRVSNRPMIAQAIAPISVATNGVSVTTWRVMRKKRGMVASTTVLASPTR